MKKLIFIFLLHIPLLLNGQTLEKISDSSLIYKVIIGLHKNATSLEQVKDWEEKSGLAVETYVEPIYRSGKHSYDYIYYCVGRFRNEKNAEQLCEEMKRIGFDSPYVQSFYDGVPDDLNE